MAKSNSVIIKKIKKGGHGHHGGAWKVAYADFVTAMMAFFLLLWLLNATTDAQKRGIADYFAPTMATKSTTSGAGGVMGGRAMASSGSQISNFSPPTIETDPAEPPSSDDGEANQYGQSKKEADDPTDASGSKSQQGNGPNPGAWKQPNDASLQGKMAKAETQEEKDAEDVADHKMTDAQFQAMKAKREEKQFTTAEYQLQQAIQNVPDLKPLARNLVVDRTEEGLRIQLVDQDKTAMFNTGSTALSPQAAKLMGLVMKAIDKLPNRLAITGHTDSIQFSGNGDYSNWELSADRANAARRALIANGLPADRIASVQGKADTENLIKEDPSDPRNRRISIVVLRDAAPAANPASAAQPSTAAHPPQQQASASP